MTAVNKTQISRFHRIYLIAKRDYFGYVKTWGFWVSFFLPFVLGALGVLAASVNLDVSPTRYEAILDETGQHVTGILARNTAEREKIERDLIKNVTRLTMSADEKTEVLAAYDRGGMEAARETITAKIPNLSSQIKLPERKTIFIDPPAQTIAELQPYLRGDKRVDYQGEAVRLNGVMHIFDKDGLQAQYWSENINNHTVNEMTYEYFRDRATRLYLGSGGLTPEGLKSARRGLVSIQSFDPSKTITDDTNDQVVTRIDRIPYIVAGVLTVILWLSVFSGSYMLLTSMLEEKLNKLLEMMLASTRFSEIMFGKLLGVAALTLTAMLPYIAIAVVTAVAIIIFGDPAVSNMMRQALSPKILFFFSVFLILGYLFYGAFFITLGALAQSMQDAQTLTTPIMLILMVCVAIVPVGIENPDASLLTLASLFPLSAPFAMIIRLPSDPPLWELCLSAGIVLASALGVIWIAGRAFRFGVLSGSGVKAVRQWFLRTILRRPT